jgi:hypothetical protein
LAQEVEVGFLPSTSVPDSEYLLKRSTTEAALAGKASTESAAAAHRKIACCYLARLFAPAKRAADLEEPGARMFAVDREADRPARVRFTELTLLPDNDELIGLLHRLD